MAKLRIPQKKVARPLTAPMKPPAQLMQEAFALQQQGKSAEAVQNCKKILDQVDIGDTAESAALLWIKLSPETAGAWTLLGRVLNQNAKNDKALEALSIALRLDPESPEAWHYQAIALKQEGKMAEALFSFDKAVELKPDAYPFRSNRINVYLDMGAWDEAHAELTDLLAKYPNDATIQALAGRYYNATGDVVNAEIHLRKAHHLQPNNPAILINLIGAVGKVGQDPEGLYKLWHKTNAVIDKLPEKNLHSSERKQIDIFIAMHDKKILEEGDILARCRNIDNVVTNEENITVTPIDAWRRLYTFRNYRLHTEEWTIYNQDYMFANLTVVGERSHCNFLNDGSVYVTDSQYDELKLEGPHILLGGAENYYHWWIDFLPRAGVIAEFPELAHLPIIVLKTLNKNQLKALQKVGIDLDRLVMVPKHHTLLCDEIILPHLLGRPMHENDQPDWMKPMVNDWVVNWVRDQFADWRKPKPHDPRRIFISREGTRFRRCINEAEVYAIAQKHGFTTLKNEDMTFADQVSLYAGVDMVMGAHGAGFTNMLFAPESATAIEMFPKHRSPPFYRELCGQLNQRYIKFDGLITNLAPGLKPDFGDFYIDPQDVERVLSSL